MKTSKKGITLVELIICCGIIVMLGGACTAVLMSGERIFSRSSSSANAQLDTDVVQSYLTYILPRATTITQLPDSSAASIPSTGVCVYFDETDDTFVIRVDGKDTAIRSVTSFTYSLVRAGDPLSVSARAQFVYTFGTNDGASYTSGFVLSNKAYSDIIAQADMTSTTDVDAAEHPICFEIAAAGS